LEDGNGILYPTNLQGRSFSTFVFLESSTWHISSTSDERRFLKLQIEVLKFEVADISHQSDSSIDKYYHGKHVFESHVLFVHVVFLSSTTK